MNNRNPLFNIRFSQLHSVNSGSIHDYEGLLLITTFESFAWNNHPNYDAIKDRVSGNRVSLNRGLLVNWKMDRTLKVLPYPVRRKTDCGRKRGLNT